MERTDKSVDDFLAGLDSPDADSLRTLDAEITEAFPGVSRDLWGGIFWGGTEQQIIGYGRISQPRPRGADVNWFVVGLASQKKHLSVYLNVADDGQYVVQRWAGKLGKVKVGSAAITFASVEALDLEAFRAFLAEAARLSPDAT